MTSPHLRIQSLQRLEFDRASKFQERMLVSQWVAAIAAAIAVLVASETVLYFFAVASVAASLAWSFFNFKYKASKYQADRARRATLLMGGLQFQLSRSEWLDLESSFAKPGEKATQYENEDYYAAQSPAGVDRLGEMLEESAFWSAFLTKKSATIAWVYFAFWVVLSVTILLLVIPFLKQEAVLNAVRVFCATIPLFLSGDILGNARAYSLSSRTLDTIGTRIANARQRGFPIQEVSVILGDYNAAVEAAPTYPPWLYTRHVETLNRMWSDRNKPSLGLGG